MKARNLRRASGFLILLSFAAFNLGASDLTMGIRELGGRALILRGDQVLTGEEGMRLESQDQIITAVGAHADIVWPDRWGYRMLEKSACRLEATDDVTIRLEMIVGSVLLKVGQLGEKASFEIDTPVAKASASGARFWSLVMPSEKGSATTFVVLDGQIHLKVKMTDEAIVLNQTQAIDIYPEQAHPEVRAIKEAETLYLEQTGDIAIESR